MSVIVKSGTVYDGTQTYKPGDTISGLSEKDEQELVADGVVERVGTTEDPEEDKEPKDPPAGNDDEEQEEEAEPEDETEEEGPDTSIPGLDDKPKSNRRR